MANQKRLLISAIIGVVILAASVIYHHLIHQSLGDFGVPLCQAESLLNGVDPYKNCIFIKALGPMPTNPMTTTLAVMPFLPFGRLAPAVIFSLSSGLLAYGLIGKEQQYWRLIMFCSYPFLFAFWAQQWSPLMAAIALFPSLLPLAIIKPHLGIPVILTNLTPKRILGILLFFLLTVALDSTWLLRWLYQARETYSGYIPIAVLPFGPLLALSLVRWREKSARFLFFMSLIPQRMFYDPLLLMLVPRTPRQLAFTVGFSWLAPIIIGNRPFYDIGPHSQLVLATLYLPSLAIVLLSDAHYRKLGRIIPSRLNVQ